MKCFVFLGLLLQKSEICNDILKQSFCAGGGGIVGIHTRTESKGEGLLLEAC
jgi:hypothetical protein